VRCERADAPIDRDVRVVTIRSFFDNDRDFVLDTL
jgi:hypothetical protein